LVGATTAGSDEGGKTFSEDATGAAGIDAAKAPDVEMEGEGHTANRQIGDVALVATVDAAGATMAQGASSGAANGGRDETHAVVIHCESVNVQTGEMGEEGGNTHGNDSFGDGCDEESVVAEKERQRVVWRG